MTRVMLVDDSDDIRELLTFLLRRQTDWEVCPDFPNGQVAVDAVADIDPDLVVLDAAMPVMDGLEALPLLRERAPRAVVVMLSAFPDVVLSEQALAAGAAAYLEKQNLGRALVPALRRILEEHRPATGA